MEQASLTNFFYKLISFDVVFDEFSCSISKRHWGDDGWKLKFLNNKFAFYKFS